MSFHLKKHKTVGLKTLTNSDTTVLGPVVQCEVPELCLCLELMAFNFISCFVFFRFAQLMGCLSRNGVQPDRFDDNNGTLQGRIVRSR